jgi:hypothetical protein
MTFLAMNPVDVSSLLNIRLRSDFQGLVVGIGQAIEDQAATKAQGSHTETIHVSNCTALMAGLQKPHFSSDSCCFNQRSLTNTRISLLVAQQHSQRYTLKSIFRPDCIFQITEVGGWNFLCGFDKQRKGGRLGRHLRDKHGLFGIAPDQCNRIFF